MRWQETRTNTSDPKIWRSWEMILCLLKDTWASAWEPAPPGIVFAAPRLCESPQWNVFTNRARSSSQSWSLFWSEVERVYFRITVIPRLYSICSSQFYFLFFIHVGFLWQWYRRVFAFSGRCLCSEHLQDGSLLAVHNLSRNWSRAASKNRLILTLVLLNGLIQPKNVHARKTEWPSFCYFGAFVSLRVLVSNAIKANIEENAPKNKKAGGP